MAKGTLLQRWVTSPAEQAAVNTMGSSPNVSNYRDVGWVERFSATQPTQAALPMNWMAIPDDATPA